MLERLIPLRREDWNAFYSKASGIFVLSALCLVGIRYFAGSHTFVKFRFLFEWIGAGSTAENFDRMLSYHPHADLLQLVYWVCGSVFFYLVVPLLVILFVYKESPANYGLKLKGMFAGWQAYGIMLMIVLPAVFYVSLSDEFKTTYPFYRIRESSDMWPRFAIWEAFYILQFFALEFFFRGFMVLGLKKYLGIWSVWAMMIPYCMIHFAKPLPECLGSIIAGLILGLMSYRTGSVILGACLHVCVALTMDFLSLYHRGII
jgi:membrane protease YdiL (CAAX protease family)